MSGSPADSIIQVSSGPKNSDGTIILDELSECIRSDIDVSNYDHVGNNIHDVQRSSSTVFPINKLPTNILLKVFLLLSRSHWDWLTVTKVCRYWRNLSLEYPTLWSDINNIFHIDKVRTFLERSNQADLFITFIAKSPFRSDGDGDYIPLDIFSLIGNNMARVRELTISTEEYNTALWDNVEKMFSESSSPVRLKKLSLRASLHIPTSHNTRVRVNNRECFQLHEDLLHLNQLEELSLRLFYVRNWSSPILLHGLTKLSLSMIEDIWKRPTLSELLDILESCPKLRSLELYNAGPEPDRSTNVRNHYRSINLPDLMFIGLLEIDADICRILFSHLNLPTNHDINWQISCNKYPFNLPSSLTQSFIPNLLSSGFGQGCKHIDVVFKDSCLSISADRKGEEKRSGYFERDACLYLHWECPVNWYSSRDIFIQRIKSVFSFIASILTHELYKNANVSFKFIGKDTQLISTISKSTWIQLFESIHLQMTCLFVVFPSPAIFDVDADENSRLEAFIGALVESVSKILMNNYDEYVSVTNDYYTAQTLRQTLSYPLTRSFEKHLKPTCFCEEPYI